MFGNKDPKKPLLLYLESERAFDIQIPSVPAQRHYHCDDRLPWNPTTFTAVADIVQQFHIGLVLDALSDPPRQPQAPQQPRISSGPDLLIRHDHHRELLPQGVSFVVLVRMPDLDCHLIPWSGRTWEEDRPVSYGSELVEIATEQDDGDPAKVLFSLPNPAKMFIAAYTYKL